MRNAHILLRRLRRNRSGVAMVEFALSLPFLLTMGLWAAETANLAIVNMRIGQLAVQIADGASRIGDTSTLQNRKIYERDINDIIQGANVQAGRSLDFFNRGRVIISSLEVYDPDNDGVGPQYIHWQRCKGVKNWPSSFGISGQGTDGSLPGMGPAGEEVMALPGEAVIFVEVAYDYRPLVSQIFASNSLIKSTSTFTVRDSRDLSQIYQRVPASPDPQALCNVFNAPPASPY